MSRSQQIQQGFSALQDTDENVLTLSTAEIQSHALSHNPGTYSDNSLEGKKPLSLSRFASEASSYLWQQYNEGNFTLFFAWVLWIAVGTIFYAEYNFAGGYAKGFFYSVNVGYSIGWGILGDYTDGCKLFSVAYILIGAVFATRAIVSLAENAVKENESVHEQLLMRRILKSQTSLQGLSADYHIWAVMNAGRFFVVYVWIVYLFLGVAWSCSLVKEFSFIDGLYFSLSSMSTGGLYSFPEDSSALVYVLCGLYAALGVPLMALAVTNIAQLFVEAHRLQRLRLTSRVLLSEEDLETLRALHFDVGDAAQALTSRHKGEQALDRQHFLVLMLVKKGLIKLEEVSTIMRDFDSLQCDSKGRVAYETLFEQGLLQERKTALETVTETVKEVVKEQGQIVLNVLHGDRDNMV
jgi:hypothetical protein